MTQPIPFTGRFEKEYNVLGELSTGKYVDVFKVKHLTDENEYAVKRIKIEQIDDLEKLREEVTNLARFKHETIVSYNTSWLEDHDQTGIPGYLFVALELGDMTLQQWFRETENRGELDWGTNSFWKQLTCGLYYIHDRDIIHGNLKPSNILLFLNGLPVNRETVLKIGNFGNVKNTYNVNDEGNPESRYLAPELRSGSAAERQEKWDIAVDYYSLGLILIELRYRMTDEEMNTVCANRRSDIVPDFLKRKADADMDDGWAYSESSSCLLIEMTGNDPDRRYRYGRYWDLIWDEEDRDDDDEDEGEP